jgi:hypothetical protein
MDESIMNDIDERLTRIEKTLESLEELLRTQRTAKDWYTTSELAKLLNRDPYTVREWARGGRIHATKRQTGRGKSKDWCVSHSELQRIRNNGLLPPPKRGFSKP